MSAWIETGDLFKSMTIGAVALRVSAWIETLGGGLVGEMTSVALRVSAWIETHTLCLKWNHGMSRSV